MDSYKKEFLYRDSNIYGFLHKRIPVYIYRDSNILGFLSIGMPRIPACRDSCMQGFLYTGVPTYRDSYLQGFLPAGIPIYEDSCM